MASQSAASHSFNAPGTRSVSTPLPSQPRPAKSTPALNASQNSSAVQRMVAHFDKNNTAHTPPRPTGPRSVSASQTSLPRRSTPTPQLPENTSPLHEQRARLRKPPPRPTSPQRSRAPQPTEELQSLQQPPRKRPNTANPKPQDQPERPPSRPQQRLFGEIQDALPGDISLGYGIPQYRGRSDSAPSMHLPNAMFPPPNHMELVPPTQLGHQRAKSDMTSVKEPLGLSSLESFLPDPVRRDVHIRLQSRTPPANHSTSSRAADDGSHISFIPPPPPSASFEPLYSSFSRSPEQRLNADIKEASPKKNLPSLRSSRPRQQLSTLTNPSLDAHHSSSSPERSMPGAFRSSFIEPSQDFVTNTLSSRATSKQSSHDQEKPHLPHNLDGPQLPNTTFKKKSGPNLTVTTGNPQHSRAPTPGSITEFEENATDFEEDTPLSATQPKFPADSAPPFEESPVEPSFSIFNRSSDAKPEGKNPPHQGLSIQTETGPSRLLPKLLDGTADSDSVRPHDEETPELFEIVLGETMVLDQSDINEHFTHRALGSENASDSKDTITPQDLDTARLSPFTPSTGDTLTRQQSLKVDETGYAAFHQIIQEYKWPSPISPEKVEQLQEHIHDGNFEYQDKASLENALSLTAKSSQQLQHKPSRTNATDAVVVRKTDTDPRSEESEPSPHTESVSTSTLIGSEDGTASTVTQNQNRFSTQTAASDQPSLPEIQDTGGGLGLLGHEENKTSPLLQTGSGPSGPTSRSTGSSIGSQQYPPSIYARSSDSQQASAGQREIPLDTPPTSSSRTLSIHSSELSSRNDSVDKGIAAFSDPAALSSTDSSTRKSRKLIIQELIDTEFAFHQDMRVMQDIYMATASSCSELTQEDIRVLFGNTQAVAEVSRVLADRLKKGTKGVYVKSRGHKGPHPLQDLNRKSSQSASGGLQGEEKSEEQADREAAVGKVFLENLGRLEKAFAEYVRNNDNANKLFQRIKNKEKVKMWLGECQEYAKDLTEAWDLDALIIKPTQRILKYSMLLHELLKKTPLDHPDRPSLVQAEQGIVHVSHRINDSKRRHELVQEVFKTRAQKDIGAKKLFNRRAEKLRQQVGLSETVQDQQYSDCAHKFNNAALRIQFLMRDYQSFESRAEDLMKQHIRLAEAMEQIIDVRPSTTPAIESKWRRWAMVIRELAAIGFQDHIQQVRKYGSGLLELAISYYDRPQALMAERKSRLPEYAKYKSSNDKGEKMDKKMKEQGEQFMALNDTLKEQLPLLDQRIEHVAKESCQLHTELMRRWYDLMHKKLRPILDDEVWGLSPEEIVRDFQSDFQYTDEEVCALSICNGRLLQDTQSFFSSSEFMSKTTLSSGQTSPGFPSQRPSHRTSGSSMSPPNSGAGGPRPSIDSEHIGPLDTRTRSKSTGRIAQLPRAAFTQSDASGTFFIGQTPPLHTNSAQSYESAGRYHSSQSRPMSNQTYHTAHSVQPSANQFARQSQSPQPPSQSVFSSALPMSDSPVEGGSMERSERTSQGGNREYPVLFLAASLFDFSIDRTRKEAGYPYLEYVPGEIFDVIGEKGELWLAKNQDDATNTWGWIWEKHFAKLMGDDTY